jgi:hypothetical protein
VSVCGIGICPPILNATPCPCARAPTIRREQEEAVAPAKQWSPAARGHLQRPFTPPRALAAKAIGHDSHCAVGQEDLDLRRSTQMHRAGPSGGDLCRRRALHRVCGARSLSANQNTSSRGCVRSGVVRTFSGCPAAPGLGACSTSMPPFSRAAHCAATAPGPLWGGGNSRGASSARQAVGRAVHTRPA